MPVKPAPPLNVRDFTSQPEVQACLNQLRQHFNSSNPLLMSDVLDEDGHQFVHLVQKGGGTLGVALVGYTYVLEQMGLRFLKQAGTSAGAINTALMTVIGNKQDAKSEGVLQAICGLNFFSLVDGHPAARWVIKNFIKNDDFGAKIQRWVMRFAAILGLLFVADIFLMGAQHHLPVLSFFAGLSFVLTGLFLLVVVVVVVYVMTLFKRLKNAGYGINPGNFFYTWIKEQLKKNGVETVTQLNQKASASIPGLKLRVDHPKQLKGLEGEVTFIASELVTEVKYSFRPCVTCFAFLTLSIPFSPPDLSGRRCRFPSFLSPI